MIRAFLAIVALCLPSIAWAQTANLWIDTNGGTCTRQGTAATYVDAAACSSMQTAIAACTAGDTIRMKAGSYGSQTITATKTTPGCTVIAESTTTLTGTLTTNGAWYEIQNVSGTGWNITARGVNNIICRDCHFSGNSGVTWQNSGGGADGVMYSDISWIGGSLTNFSTSGDACAFCIYTMADVAGGNGYTVDTLLIEGVTFDDVVNTGGVGNHFEVIRVDGNIDGFHLRRSTFTNNVTSTALIFFTTFRGDKPQNITIENNFFGDLGDAFNTIDMNFGGLTCSNWTFRYNTFLDSPLAGGNCSYSSVLWVGNLMPRGSCQGNTFRYNVGYGSSGSACSGTGNSVTTTAGAALGGAGGFYLQSGSTAIDAAADAGSDCISNDHDGNSRYTGARCDAGAHEYGAGAGSAPSAPANFRTAFFPRWPTWLY